MVTLPPFRSFLASNIPSVYDNTLSYYDELTKLIGWLDKQVVPQVNENTTGIQTLRDYVEHYFDNLDVQEEINNKLDEMAEDGELEEIVTHYLELAGVLCFNTLADMQDATNLIDGSFARTFGKVTYNDGKGELYKIRTMTSGDTVDGDNIVSVNFSNTIIGEKQQSARLDAIEDSIAHIDDKEIILIGDSYLAGQSLPTPATQNFGYLLMQKLGMNSSNFHIYGEGGSSFVSAGNAGHTWQSLLQSKVSEIADVNKVTDIWFFGGYNDVTAANPAQIELAMSNCIAYAKSTFPKAEVRIALIANNASNLQEQVTNRNLLKNRVYNVYTNCFKYGAICVPKAQLPMQDYTLYEDNATAVHPNVQGHKDIADWLYQLIYSGDSTFYKTHNAFNLTIDSSVGTPNNFIMTEEIKNENVYAGFNGELTLATPISNGFGDINLGTQSDIHFLKYVGSTPDRNFSEAVTIRGITDLQANTETPVVVTFRINPSGNLVLRYQISNTSTSIKKLVFNWNWFRFSTQGC